MDLQIQCRCFLFWYGVQENDGWHFLSKHREMTAHFAESWEFPKPTTCIAQQKQGSADSDEPAALFFSFLRGMRSGPYTGQTALQKQRTHAAHRPSGH